MAYTSRGILRLVLCFGGYILFLAFGATVFSAIEGPEEQEEGQLLRNLRSKFLEDHQCVADADLEELIVQIVNAANRGVSAARNVSGEPNWSFGQSIFFASTVLTTIGYGHVTPLSRAGKLFCVIYAIFGIPFTLIVISAVVSRIMIPATWILQKLNSKLGHLYPPLYIRILHLIMVTATMLLVFMAMPAAAFAYIEPDWDFYDAFYYCFISLTTIGLGDYIPGDSPDQPYRPLYKICTTIYLFSGMTYMMMVLAVFYDIPQLNLGLLFVPDNVDGNSEKARLATAASGIGLQYGIDSGYSPQVEDNGHRRVVRVRSRRDDSPSPEESTPPTVSLTSIPRPTSQ